MILAQIRISHRQQFTSFGGSKCQTSERLCDFEISNQNTSQYHHQCLFLKSILGARRFESIFGFFTWIPNVYRPTYNLVSAQNLLNPLGNYKLYYVFVQSRNIVAIALKINTRLKSNVTFRKFQLSNQNCAKYLHFLAEFSPSLEYQRRSNLFFAENYYSILVMNCLMKDLHVSFCAHTLQEL